MFNVMCIHDTAHSCTETPKYFCMCFTSLTYFMEIVASWHWFRISAWGLEGFLITHYIFLSLLVHFLSFLLFLILYHFHCLFVLMFSVYCCKHDGMIWWPYSLHSLNCFAIWGFILLLYYHNFVHPCICLWTIIPQSSFLEFSNLGNLSVSLFYLFFLLCLSWISNPL